MTVPTRRTAAVPTMREPVLQFDDLWNRLGQLFDQARDNRDGDAAWVPAVEAEETDDGYVVRAELPGLKRDDVDVNVSGQELTISGEIRQEEPGEVLRRRTGKFLYRTGLPADADPERIEANLRDGVLTVRIPKSERALPRKVEIGGD